MEKYKPLIEKVNYYIEEFNSYLKDKYAVQLLDLNEYDNQGYFLNVCNTKWDDYPFPRNREVGGVYFYFGTSELDSNKLGIYVGKASLSSKIGNRLYQHFRKVWNEEIITIKDTKGHPFKVEMITSIPFEKREEVFLAPALEEFLIESLQEDCILINGVGNYQ